MNNPKVKVFLLILAVLVTVAGILILKPSLSEKKEALPLKKLNETVQTSSQEVPQTNPFEEAKTNPFKDIKTNPFE